MVSEAEVVASIDIQLAKLGWHLDIKNPGRNVYKGKAKTKEQNFKLEGKQPDYICYAQDDSDIPTLIIEAKKPNFSLEKALEQGINRYAKKIRAPLVIASDGYRTKTWHVKKKAPLIFNARELDELITPDLARKFVETNEVDSFAGMVIGREDLITKFKKANNILRPNFDIGMDRFSEFANLMFVKLWMESNCEIAGYTSWEEIKEKRGKALLKAIQNILRELRNNYGKLFEKSKIEDPKKIEALVEILSPLNLLQIKSDVKGMAFEHFIHSYTKGARNDLGQYFTPRHIIKAMVHFLKPRAGEKIYDPFCGTGGMLIEIFRYMKHNIKNDKDNNIKNDKDNEEIKKLEEETLYGCDSSSVARIAMMNMIMFGDGHTNIIRHDSYERLKEVKRKYDIVITNIPFSQPVENSNEYPVFPKGNKERHGDSIGVQHSIESLKKSPNSRAAIIVPIGFLHKDILEEERRYILSNFNLERVVELSPNCFQPYTSQHTAILMLRGKKISSVPDPSTHRFEYHTIKNDGFSQDGHRVLLSGTNDLDLFMDGKQGKIIKVDLKENIKFKKLGILQVAGNQDKLPLDEVANVIRGDNITPKKSPQYIENGKHPILMASDLAKNHITYYLDESIYKINEKAVIEKKPYYFPKHTILIPTSGRSALKNHRAILGTEAYLTGVLTGIIAKTDKIHPFCLFHFFLKFDIGNLAYNMGYPGIRLAELKSLKIPKYTANETSRIVATVEKLIKLSRAVKMTHKELMNL